jgi:hypothetical protein
MRTKLFKKFSANIPAMLAIAIFIIAGSLKQKTDDNKEAPAAQCCSGYSVPISLLQQFMLDSLNSTQFEGGKYSKADLLNAINNTPGDTIYLVNVLLNCQVAKGTDLALTSRTAKGFSFVRKKCIGCPYKPCCTRFAGAADTNSNPVVCVARIKRGCISYIPFATPEANTQSLSSSK